MDINTAARFVLHVLRGEDALGNLEPDSPTNSSNDVARFIGGTIYELPFKFTGMVSSTLIDINGHRSKIYTREHFYSRQQSGRIIIEQYINGTLDYRHLLMLLDMFRQVHYVTAQENTRLTPFQNKPEYRHLSWEEQYALAKVVLVKDPGVAPAYMTYQYIIYNIKYDNIAQAAEATGMHYLEIRQRSACSKTINKQFVHITNIKKKLPRNTKIS